MPHDVAARKQPSGSEQSRHPDVWIGLIQSFGSQRLKMHHRFIATALAGLLVVTPALSQTNAPASAKAETSCTTTSNTTTGSAGKTADTSMAMEKSAILPDAGGEGTSAAPTVQSDGKAMEVKKDCPPETRGK
jgi:hypothetical protein